MTPLFVRTPKKQLVKARFNSHHSNCQVSLNDHLNAQAALSAAIQSLSFLAPRPRDFGSCRELFTAAHTQHRARVESVMAVRDEGGDLLEDLGLRRWTGG